VSARVKVKAERGAKAPEYKTVGSAGADVSAFLPDSPVSLGPGEYKAIPTGLSFEIPIGYEIQVRPRSGLALKSGITVLNAPGTIDSDYRGEVKVILVNHSKNEFVIHDGDRIAQLVLSSVDKADFSLDDDISQTERGSGGFGSTGI